MNLGSLRRDWAGSATKRELRDQRLGRERLATLMGVTGRGAGERICARVRNLHIARTPELLSSLQARQAERILKSRYNFNVLTVRLTLLPDDVCADVVAGEVGVDIFDEHPQISVPLSCRSAHCGSCLVRVVTGAAALGAATDWEKETLQKFGSDPALRLGCSIVIISDTGEITLERATPSALG